MNLSVKNISKTFTGRKHKVQALDNISFDLKSGTALGIVGESGSGKTTLSKIIAGFEMPDQGEIFLDDKSSATISRRDRSRFVQMVFQDPFASLNPKLLLRSQLEEGLIAHKFPDIVGRCHRLMKDVGLDPGFLDRYPHQLSGGQRQRFAIARALSLEPKLLLADEPVSSLDISIQAQIINLLNRLRDEHGYSLIVISHDLAVVGHLCDSILVLHQGKQIEFGSAKKLLTSPDAAYTQNLLRATPVL